MNTKKQQKLRSRSKVGFSRLGLALALLVLIVGVAPVSATQAATAAYAPQLTRYPYLTDVVLGNATVNFATDQSQNTAFVKYGEVGVESCTAHTVVASHLGFQVYPSPYDPVNNPPKQEFQWKAMLVVKPDTQYCYRVYLGSAPEIDLLGGDQSPTFWTQIPAGSNQPFSFAVLADWGYVQPDGTNTHQAALLKLLSSQNPRFVVTAGDNRYATTGYLSVPLQTQYGDLYQSGPSTSAVFGPNFWKQVGSTIPIFPAIGNHGYSGATINHPHIMNWPQDTAVQSSAGRYATDLYQGFNGTTPTNYPSVWYAFDAGVARFYILEATWADTNIGTADLYKNDYDYHWAPGSQEYEWLKADLQAHPGGVKFALFHFPMYSDSNATDTSDTYLQGPSSLEGLLSANGVQMGFSGHAHFYQRSNPANSNSLVTYVVGGGGATLSPIGPICSPNTGYGIGWSPTTNKGSKCGSATIPTDIRQVYSFLMVSVNGYDVTVTPINELGQPFDAQTYHFTPSTGTPQNRLFLPLMVR